METHSHARHAFADELKQLEHDILDMGSRAESMVAQAADALCRLDVNLAREVIIRDDEIDQRDLAIEQRCLRLLALQQPMASDLRIVGTAMKMITDIERVADLAVDVAKIALKVDRELGDTRFIDIPKMANIARTMLRQAMEAYVKHDLELVRLVCEKDDEVDELYRQLRAQIHENMKQFPEQVVADSWLMLAIHHVERIADHAVNIAERVSFMVTGRLEQLASSHRSDMPTA